MPEQGSGGTSVSYISRSGFLCDEVGMGKTLVCISLIVTNPCTDAFDGGTDGKGWQVTFKLRGFLGLTPRPGSMATAASNHNPHPPQIWLARTLAEQRPPKVK